MALPLATLATVRSVASLSADGIGLSLTIDWLRGRLRMPMRTYGDLGGAATIAQNRQE